MILSNSQMNLPHQEGCICWEIPCALLSDLRLQTNRGFFIFRMVLSWALTFSRQWDERKIRLICFLHCWLVRVPYQYSLLRSTMRSPKFMFWELNSKFGCWLYVQAGPFGSRAAFRIRWVFEGRTPWWCQWLLWLLLFQLGIIYIHFERRILNYENATIKLICSEHFWFINEQNIKVLHKL